MTSTKKGFSAEEIDICLVYMPVASQIDPPLWRYVKRRILA